MNAPGHDLRIGDLYDFSWWRDAADIRLGGSALTDVANSFTENMRRVLHNICIIPCMMKLLETEKNSILKRRMQPIVNKLSPMDAVHLNGIIEDVLRRPVGMSRLYMPGWAMDLTMGAYSPVEQMRGVISLPIGTAGLLDTFPSLIVSTWTAFEILATDLWVEAVNQRPDSLGYHAWVVCRADDSDDELSRKMKSAFPVDMVREYGFDLSKKMGSAMHARRDYGFNKLSDLEQAYMAAFRVQKPKGGFAIHPHVKQWFSGAHYDQLGTTEAIRHVFVHRGGRADASFLRRMEKHPVFGKLALKEPVPIDGETVAKCIKSVVQCGVTLLTGVDKWLTDNPR